MQNETFPKVLIVGTLPYDPNESSRALDTYFHNWPKNRLHMVFSNSKSPKHGHCGSFFQITDKDVFRNIGKHKTCVGRIFEDSELKDDDNVALGSNDKGLHKLIKKKNWIRFYLRRHLWGKNRWVSNSLLKWADDFSPDAIYICFSDDYFILDISLFFAKRFNIPIIAQIGDDYYFKKYNFLMKSYIKKYKRLFNEIMNTSGFGVYISDKLARKYNSHFKKQGFPIYLSSSIEHKKQQISYSFNYFGKTDLGRYKSLCLLGDSLHLIDSSYHINVYSNYRKNSIKKCLEKHNCFCHSSVPYERVQEIMNSGQFNIVASGFGKSDIETTRYSLSTKIADSLASSGPILAIGPKDDGAIDYLLENQCGIVLTDKRIDIKQLKASFENKEALYDMISIANNVFQKKHSLELNRKKFEDECKKITRERYD